MVEQRLDLLRLTEKIYDFKGEISKEKTPSFWSDLTNHAEKYFYIHNSYSQFQNLAEKDFLKEIDAERRRPLKEVKEDIRGIEMAGTKLQEQKNKTIKKLSLNTKTIKTLEALALFGWWQDERKKMTLIGNYYLVLLLKQIAKKVEIPLDYILYATPEEITEIENNKQILKTLNERKSASFIYEDDKGNELIFSGERVGHLKKLAMQENKLDDFKIEGVVASKGVVQTVRGKVRIVLDPNKDDFEEGELLVTTMTRPEFVPLMRKAKGVITNEGGITSHAAIISREFGIPCIVGTREATNFFKTGEMAEMRMNHGTIQKLN